MEKIEKLKIFYEAIGYKPFQEIRMFKDGAIKSVFPSSFEQTMKIIEDFKDWNCYVGVNPRKAKGSSEDEVAYRQMMVFDVEQVGKKPPLSDLDYKQRLHKATNFIKRVVKEECGALLTFIVTSGRGIHLYFRVVPIENMYQDDYYDFYNDVVSRINRQIGKIGLKADPPVKDLPRIFGCPGTFNTKYPNEETAERKILFYEDTIKEILPTLLDYREQRKKITSELKIVRAKNPLSVVRRMQEYKMFKAKFRLPENSGVNNWLRFAIRLKLREVGATRQECSVLAREIQSFGYPNKSMYLPPGKYLNAQYSNVLAQNFAYNNYDWFVKAQFPFPYFKPNKLAKQNYDLPKDREFPIEKVETWDEAKVYAIKFNQATKEKYDSVYAYYPVSLLKHLKQCCNPTLYKFIEDNNLITYLKYREFVIDVDERDELELVDGKYK